MWKRVISFFLWCTYSENLAKLIYQELLEYRIYDKIFTISIDNDSNNNVDVKIFLVVYYYYLVIYIDDFFHVRCIPIL